MTKGACNDVTGSRGVRGGQRSTGHAAGHDQLTGKLSGQGRDELHHFLGHELSASDQGLGVAFRSAKLTLSRVERHTKTVYLLPRLPVNYSPTPSYSCGFFLTYFIPKPAL